MKPSASAIAAMLLAATTVGAQDPSRLHTHPTAPTPESLEKLNLKLGWRTYVPMDGSRDSIFSVQNTGDLLLIQTRSGLVMAVDVATGHTRWQARVGRPYHVSVRLGYNTDVVLVVNDETLYVLDRNTGQFVWGFDMPSAATAAPVADDEQVFLSLRGGTLSAYSIPKTNPDLAKPSSKDKKSFPSEARAADAGVAGYGVGLTTSIGAMTSARGRGTQSLISIGALTSARQASQSQQASVEPRRDWSDNSGLRLDLAPLLTDDTVFVVGGFGKMAALAKGVTRSEHYVRVLADDEIVVPPGQHGEEAYVASHDSNLYAVSIPTGSIHWRLTTGTPIIRKPAVTDDDVYITTDRGGLRRLDRGSGRQIWQNPSAKYYLASNPKCVYATDRSGRMLLLDRRLGTQLGTLDVRDFVVPVSNDMTDRVFLIANDGMLVCLHDREYGNPLAVKKVEPKKTVKAKKGDKPQPEDKPRAKPKPKTDDAAPLPPDAGKNDEKKDMDKDMEKPKEKQNEKKQQ
jgi:outer membrane protein assembly factor BamB